MIFFLFFIYRFIKFVMDRERTTRWAGYLPCFQLKYIYQHSRSKINPLHPAEQSPPDFRISGL